MNQDEQATNIKRFALVVVFVVFAMLVFSWIFSHSFIEINIVGGGTGGDSITYQLTEQATKKTSTVKTNELSIKKLVRKGSYEVTVINSDSNYFAVVKTKPFLSTTDVDAQPEKEKNRTFVGDNPDPCMYYDGTLLYSYGCGASFDALKLHLPATNDTPTTTTSPVTDITFPIESMLSVSGSNHILLQNDYPNEEGETSLENQFILPINNALELTANKKLSGAVGDISYSAQPYKEGFIAYSSDYKNILYYPSVDASPTTIKIDRPSEKPMYPVDIDINNDEIALAYSSLSPADYTDQEGPVLSGKTIVELYDTSSTQTSSYTFNVAANHVKLCGKQAVCIKSSHELFVYDISDGVEKQFVVQNVQQIENSGDKFLVATNMGILNLNVNAGTGSYEYLFGGYKFCGMNSQQIGGYVLCLINKQQDRVAIYVDEKEVNIDNIDKKILKLQEDSNVKAVSIYKNFLYISPNLGDVTYNKNTGDYGYSSSLINSTSKKINLLVKDLKIDSTKYYIKNTYQ